MALTLNEAKKRAESNLLRARLASYDKKQNDLIDRFGGYKSEEWHSQEEANAYFNAIKEVRDLTDLYRYYNDTYGNDSTLSQQLGAAVSNYDSILSAKDDLLELYSQFDSADAFNAEYPKMLETAKKYDAENYNIDEKQSELDQLYRDREVFRGFETAVGSGQSFNQPISDSNGNDIYFTDYFPNYDKNANLDDTQGKKDALASINPEGRIRELEKELSLARVYQAPDLETNADYSIFSAETDAAKKALKGEKLDKHLTDDEKARYYYLYNKYGNGKATQYAQDLTAMLEARQLEAIENWSSQNIGTRVLGTIASTVMSGVSTVESLFDQTNYFMSGGLEELDDIYTARMTEALRAGAVKGHNGLDKFLYNTMTSGAESYAASTIPFGLGSFVLGLNASASAINSALDRGATSEQAYFSGIAAGAFEWFFETLSFGNIKSIKKFLENKDAKKTIWKIVAQVAASSGINATEEALTEIANIVYDKIALGDISNYELAMQEYISNGMSEQEAKTEVYKDLGLQVAEAAGSGALMGGMFTGLAAANVGISNARAQNKYYKSEGQSILNDTDTIEGLKYAATNEFKDVDLVAKAAKKYEKKASAKNLGRLEHEVLTEASKRSNLTWNEQKKEMAKAAAEEKKALAERASANVKKTMSEAHSEASRLKISSDGVSGIALGKMSPIVDYSDASSDKITVKDSNGNAVKLSEAELADDDVGIAYIYASQLGSVDAANAFIKAYNAETAEQGYISPDSFYVDWLSIQSHGQISTWDGAMEKAFAAVGDRMSENAKAAAFVAGRGLRESANKKFQEAQDKYDKAWKEAGGKPTDATFKDTDLRGKNLSQDQQDYRSFLRAYSRAMGTNIEVIYSEQGNRRENGSYNRDTNTLRIDINAGIGNNAIYDAVQNNVIGTLSHETVHNMRVTANKQYVSLRDFVISELEKDSDYDIEKAIEQEIVEYKEKRNEDIDREDAIEEIVARACEDRLGSSEVLRDFLIDLYAHDKDTANGFVKAVKEFLARLKAFFEKVGKMKSTAPEAQKFAQMGEDIVSELQKLFDEGVLAMREGNMARNAVKAANINIDVATESEGTTMYSSRYQAADTNLDILSMVKKVADGNFKANEKVNLGTVSNATATEIYNITGINVKGFNVAIEARQIEHIIKDHGKNGTTDRSMANPSDIAKIEYALKSYDDIRPAGKTQAYTQMIKGKNRTADTVLYEKYIGEKSYYVVQAVPDTKAKTLYIVTAFIGKKGYKKEASQLINAKSLDVTAKTGSANASTDSISQNQQKSSDFEKNSSPERNHDSDGATMYRERDEERISIGMTESERSRILKNAKITPPEISVDKAFDVDFQELEKNNWKAIKKPMLDKLRELGYLKAYKTDIVDVSFDFTGEGLRKSMNAQVADYGGNLSDLAKVVMNMQPLLDNSVLIEIHADKAKGTPRENPQLLRTYVLLSAFRESKTVTPVQFEIKQYVDDNNRLYLAVALTKIETDVISDTILENQASTRLLPVSDISIPQLIEKINPKDENFFKYVPNDLLSPEQIEAKKRALSKEAAKYGRQNDETVYQRRDELPPSSEILAELFKTNKAYEKYAERSQSLKKYKDLQVRLKNSEKRIAEIDAEIKTLRSERKQSGKGTRMDELYRMRKTAENKVESYRKQMFEMEAGDLYDVVISESARLVKEQRKKDYDHYKEKSKERTQNIAKRGYIEMIEKRVKLLSKAITENSKDTHIPEIFKKSVGDFISAIEFTSKRVLNGGQPTQKETSLVESIKNMNEMLKRTTDSELSDYLKYCDLTGAFAEEFEYIVASVNNITEKYGNNNDIVLQKMSAEELNDLNRAIRQITYLISAANKLIGGNRYAKVEAIYGQTVTDLEDFKAYSREKNSLGEKVSKSFEWDNALPYYAFKRMGKSALALFEEFQDGFDDFAFKADEIVKYTEDLFTAKESRMWTSEIHEIELIGGTVYMTTSDIMSLYCLAKRPDAKRHILQGGISLENKTGYLVGAEKLTKKTYANKRNNFVIDEPSLLKVLSLLNDRQREVADKLQSFMATVCAEWGNEVSYKRFGVKQFTDPNYFPIKSAATSTQKDETSGIKEQSIYALLNASFTQKINPNSNNPIVISDIFDVFAEHTTQMAKYHAFALPLIDMRKWQNYKLKTATNVGAQGTGFTEQGVRAMLMNAFGEEAEKYIDTFLRDINSLQNNDRGSELLQSAMSRYKVQAVAANLNVALIQPISYIRVGAVMDTRYLLSEVKDTFKIRKAIERATKYSGMMVWKNLGYRDVNIAASLADKIKHTENMFERVADKALKGAELADKLTWGAIWIACENETTAERKDLVNGTKEYYDTVAKRFREVIYATQVVDSPLTKTQFMRGKGGFNKIAGAFMSEPSVSYNLFLDAASEVVDDRRKGKKLTSKHIKKLGRAGVVLLASAFAEAFIRSFFDALHEYDDEDDEYFELYFDNFLETLFSSVLEPKTPVLKTVYEAIKGAFTGTSYSSRMDVAAFERIGRLGNNIFRAFQGKDVSWSKFLKSTLDALSAMTGIPISNVWREVKSVWNAIVGSQNPSVLIK